MPDSSNFSSTTVTSIPSFSATWLTVKKTAPKGKAAKDPNKPKRPASAFFVFMEDFRKQFKKENPNVNSVAAVGKAGGAKWKAMSESENAPFAAKSEQRKKDYDKTLAAYNKKLIIIAAGTNDEENDYDKSKSEVNDDEEDGSDEEDDE
nr:HMG1/2-like protein [Tanacetum cinerariifolium]